MNVEEVTLHVTLYFQERYIADPYWPELEQVINIQKASGMNRTRSENKRELALKEYLKRQGIEMDEYEELMRISKRPFYREHPDTWTGQIVIPAHQMYGCLIAAADTLPSSQRPCNPTNLRHLMRVSDFPTGKQTADGTYRRLVMPKSGTGQPLSNMRSLRSDPYISNFSTKGTIRFIRDTLQKADELPDFLTYAGAYIGVGAARKMNCGRFIVKEWDFVT